MAIGRYSSNAALLEYMLEGNRVTVLEAILLFGEQAPNRAFTNFKQKGFLIKSDRVPMIRVIRRINEFTTCTPPPNLPIKEINFMEYWISR